MTGTFDDWAKSVKLDKKDGTLFEKMVELPRTDEKYFYKVRESVGRVEWHAREALSHVSSIYHAWIFYTTCGGFDGRVSNLGSPLPPAPSSKRA